jgi:hypothetical protein
MLIPVEELERVLDVWLDKVHRVSKRMETTSMNRQPVKRVCLLNFSPGSSHIQPFAQGSLPCSGESTLAIQLRQLPPTLPNFQ